MLKTVSSITNAIGALNYKGTWDANANSPALSSSVGTKGDYYVVGTAGATNLNGISNWGVGDLAAFNGSVWQRVEGGTDLNGVNLTATGTVNFTGATVSNGGSVTTVDINGGTIDGTVIGGASKSTGGFTEATATTRFISSTAALVDLSAAVPLTGQSATIAGTYVVQMTSVSASVAAFLIAISFNGASINATTTALGGCTAAGATILGIGGDARTYTFARDAGTGLLVVSASSVATGTTSFRIVNLSQF